LIEEIKRTLFVEPEHHVTRKRFLVMQRIAFYGHQTIADVQGFGAVPGAKEQKAKTNLITAAYSWATDILDSKAMSGSVGMPMGDASKPPENIRTLESRRNR
jgi:hypothetical protein